MKLLGENTKTIKADKLGWKNYIMHLRPNKTVCPNASKACLAACLNLAGRGVFNSVQEVRQRKTKLYLEDREAFNLILGKELTALNRRAARTHESIAIRLNGTSDISFDFNVLGEAYTRLRFYDYTKSFERAVKYLNSRVYSITLSWSGENKKEIQDYLDMGGRVAIPFAVKKGEALPKEFMGYSVIDGDEHDLTFIQPKNCILGLRFKGGKAKMLKAIAQGFCVQA